MSKKTTKNTIEKVEGPVEKAIVLTNEAKSETVETKETTTEEALTEKPIEKVEEKVETPVEEPSTDVQPTVGRVNHRFVHNWNGVCY